MCNLSFYLKYLFINFVVDFWLRLTYVGICFGSICLSITGVIPLLFLSPNMNHFRRHSFTLPLFLPLKEVCRHIIITSIPFIPISKATRGSFFCLTFFCFIILFFFSTNIYFFNLFYSVWKVIMTLFVDKRKARWFYSRRNWNNIYF